MWFIALRDGDLARGQDGQRCRSRDRETPMSTIDPAVAINNSAGKHTRLAKQFQAYTAAHDIHNRIHRSDFMEMHLFRRKAVDFPLGDCHPEKDRYRFFFDPGGKPTGQDNLFDFRKSPFVVMIVFVFLIMFVGMVFVGMSVRVGMCMAVRVLVDMFVLDSRAMGMIVIVTMRKMNVELHAVDASFVTSVEVKMVTLQLKFLQFLLQLCRIDPQIHQGANEHVTADPAEEVQK